MWVRSAVVAMCVSCMVLVSSLSASAANGGATETLLKLLGYDTFVESFAQALRDTDNQIAGSDSGLAIAWDLAAIETFPAAKMMDEIVAAMDGTLEPTHVETATKFLETDLGVLVTKMEVEAQRPEQSDFVDAEGADILADLIATKSARLDAYTRMIEALGAIDNEVAAAMNLNYAIYAGMSQSGKLPYQLSDAEILELVVSQQDMLRSHIRDKIYVTFAYTYRDLTDAQLSDYISFLTSKAGRALYGAIQLATEDVLSKRAHRFGTRLMELQGVEEL